jgi:hypothetical protein
VQTVGGDPVQQAILEGKIEAPTAQQQPAAGSMSDDDLLDKYK